MTKKEQEEINDRLYKLRFGMDELDSIKMIPYKSPLDKYKTPNELRNALKNGESIVLGEIGMPDGFTYTKDGLRRRLRLAQKIKNFLGLSSSVDRDEFKDVRRKAGLSSIP